MAGMVVVAPATSFHHHHHHHNESSILQTHEHSLIPLLQQNYTSSHSPTLSYIKKQVPTVLDSSGFFSGGASAGGTTCQDCGNQAKKDCSHQRCRTCCKSRGFDCSTHVKSTWVPAARRRERQQMSATVPGTTAGADVSSASTTSASKKIKLLNSQNHNTGATSHTSTSNTTPSPSFDTTSSHHHHHQDASFRESLPSQLRAPAVFRCVRVTPIEDGDDQYAYQAMVKIGGHLFKGFLYDHGVDDNQATTSTGNNNVRNDAIPSMSELHLGAASGLNVSCPLSSSTTILPTDVFCSGGGAPGSGGLIGGTTNFGN